jgi:hypothetical protein
LAAGEVRLAGEPRDRARNFRRFCLLFPFKSVRPMKYRGNKSALPIVQARGIGMNVIAFLRRLSSAERAASHDAESIRERRMAEVRALLAEIASSPGRPDPDDWRSCERQTGDPRSDVCCA